MNRTCKTLIQALLAGTALTQPGPLRAGELPVGATTVHGSVGIATPSAGQMTIQQTTPTAIVNWQGFSVGAGNRVDIVQPSASSALLNRVTGSAPSTIAGQVNANGQVYLVNPNGITITPTGTVNAGAFVASTLDISDHDFSSGRRVFRGHGQSAAVSNQGTIAIRQGGYAALLGGQVDNSGVISVPMGRVGLGAGERATLDLTGDGFLQVAVPSKGDGSDAAAIRHSGRISAAGGQVVMHAATAREMARNAINLSGLVEARSVSGRNGAIVLGGGEGGRVTVTGRLDVSARAARPGPRQDTRHAARGGDITVTGQDIRLNGAALLADGQAGGGTVRVGGGYQGKGPLQRAGTTTVDAATTISADAGRTGNGGEVVIWSDISTAFAGRISARGGSEGGDGGQAEVSGKRVLAYTGATDLSAARGSFGTLLLDPYNVTIGSGADANQTGFAAAGNDSVINAGTLEAALRTANVTVTTGGAGSPGAQAGDITVAAPVTWGTNSGGGATTLTLNAFRSIGVAANLTVDGDGGLALNTNQGGTGGTLSFGPGASASFVNGVNQTLAINGQTYRLLRNAPDLVEALSDPDSATDFFALAIDADATGLPAQFQRPVNIDFQGNDIPFRGTFEGLGHTINGLGMDLPRQYVGLFGITQGATIANLNLSNVTIVGRFAGNDTSPSPTPGVDNASYAGGLVGRADATTIRGVSISGSVTNASTNDPLGAPGVFAGGLAGQSSGTVQRSFSTATVVGGNGTSATGGLVGQNLGSISQSYATGSVIGGGSEETTSDAGGLIGQNSGQVSQSYATGAVTGGGSLAETNTGGLIGQNSGQVSQSYATGAVTGGGSLGGNNTGGVIGSNNGGTVQQVYARGAVTVTANSSDGNVQTGGLIGLNGDGAAISASFWDTTTTGQAAAAGNAPTLPGATGLTTAQFQDAATFVPLASGQGWNFQTTWAPPSAGFYPELYSVSRVVSVTADPQTRTYGQSNPTLTGTVAGGPGVYAFDGSTAPADASTLLTTNATLQSDVGLYPISPIAGPYISLGGVSYRVTGTGNSLNVTPAPLTITANDASKTYGQTLALPANGFTTAGLVNGDQVTGVTLTSPGQPASAGVGAYQILASNAVGTGLTNPAGQSNYTIAYNPGTLTVTPAPLVVTANDASKTYGQTLALPANGFTTVGLVNGDQVTGVTLTSPGQPANAGVGAYQILAGNAAGTGLVNPANGQSNYAIAYNPGTLTVSPAPLVITATDQAKTVGTTFTFLGTEFTAVGLVNQDQVTTVALASEGAPSSAPAGAYPIVAGNAAGTGLVNPANGQANYAITYDPGTLTVTSAPVRPPVRNNAELASQYAGAGITPNLPSILPNFTTAALGLGDTIEFGGGGPTLGVSQGGGSGTRAGALSTLASIQAASNTLEGRLAACDKGTSRESRNLKTCYSDALDGFADTLDIQVQQLPPAFRGLPAVIRQAARQVRAARTVAEARVAVRVAVVAVRKAIALLRADEPAVARIQARQGNAIASALRMVDNRLSRATGL